MGCTEHSSSCSNEIDDTLNLRSCLTEPLEVPKGSKDNCSVRSGSQGVMEPMQGKLASSQFDFGYTKQFLIPGVTSVFFSSCDSVVGDSLEFNQANLGSLCV